MLKYQNYPPLRENERESYVDIGKGLAMIAIVCGHIASVYFPSWLTSFWPVAFFFVVAGFYIKEEKLEKPVSFISHRLKTLYLPGTVIYLVAVLLHNAFCKWGVYPIGEEHPMTRQKFVLWDIKTELIQVVKTIVAPGGELVMGAMWFLYALFFALSFLSVLYFATKWLRVDTTKKTWMRCILVVLISTFSIGVAIYGIKVPRLSNALTIMTFIFCGMIMKQRFNVKFDNSAVVILSLIVYAQCIILPHEHQSFPVNRFSDLVLPLVMSVAAVYIVLFVSKRIERTYYLSLILSYIGRESLWIMAMHIFGFFVCTWLIDFTGLGHRLYKSGMLYTYDVGNNVFLTVIYLLYGIGTPLFIMWGYRNLKKTIIKLKQ